jgi:octaheme c-type cytochrome (tetrathionate reductase family)
MKKSQRIWIYGLLATLGVILIPLVIFWPRSGEAADNPAAMVSTPVPHTSHADLMTGPYETGQDVTKACLQCHEDAATELMATSHWTWESQPFDVPWRDEPVTIGKANQINNFCIGAQGNQKSCMSCHTGYGWAENQEYDFTISENVDCLACHADTALYTRGNYGEPAEGVDLVAAARSVKAPTRDNCGKCHFDGGGGNNVKHGDLSEALNFPAPELDVHMGKLDFQCTTCHTTQDHAVKGRIQADNFVVDPKEQVACTDCHAEDLHEDERINAHAASVACQTCHIPLMATKDPTKLTWDWSTSGQDVPEDHYTYLKIKGTFTYEKNVQPEYLWSNGNQTYRYLLGDKIDPTTTTYINKPAGDITDPNARIFPFKRHTANQPFDTVNNYLLQPITAGVDGYWTNFDWDNAFKMAEDETGLAYSGNYGFAETVMFWPTTHTVQPAANALQCTDCHAPESRLDWQALGYPGDPMEWGGRFQSK